MKKQKELFWILGALLLVAALIFVFINTHESVKSKRMNLNNAVKKQHQADSIRLAVFHPFLNETFEEALAYVKLDSSCIGKRIQWLSVPKGVALDVFFHGKETEITTIAKCKLLFIGWKYYTKDAQVYLGTDIPWEFKDIGKFTLPPKDSMSVKKWHWTQIHYAFTGRLWWGYLIQDLQEYFQYCNMGSSVQVVHNKQPWAYFEPANNVSHRIPVWVNKEGYAHFQLTRKQAHLRDGIPFDANREVPPKSFYSTKPIF